MTHFTQAPSVIPEEVWRVERDVQPETAGGFTLGCIQCLQEGSGPSGNLIYMVNGTSYCPGHALSAAMKEQK